MQQQNVFLLDTCFWLYSAIIFYLTYPMNYPIIWADKEKNSITIDTISFWLNNNNKVVRHTPR